MSSPTSRDEPAVSFDEQERLDRATELEADLRWLHRRRRRDNLLALAGVLLSVGVAVSMMAMAVHVTTENEGRAWMYGGLALGNLGVFVSVLWGLHRSVERGDARW